MNDFNATKLLVKSILERATNFEWSLQGFGMLRLYLSPEVRLHVWDDRYAVTYVSTMHDHPWDFWSRVIGGKLDNQRYELFSVILPSWTPPKGQEDQYMHMMMQKIRCGVGGGLVKACMTEDEAQPVVLRKLHREGPWTAADYYHQKAEEIHVSTPARGTVTIVERHFKADTEHARVFWPRGQEWVSAEPRKATQEEIKAITHYSLERWFS